MPRWIWAIIWTIVAVIVAGLLPHVSMPLWACAVFGIGIAYFRSILLFFNIDI